MARPSIFSRDYERHRRRRKRNIIISVILLLCAAGIFISSGNIKNMIGSIRGKELSYKNIKIFSVFKRENKDTSAIDSLKKKPGEDVKSSTETDTEKQKDVYEAEEKGYDIALNSGLKIKAVFEPRDGSNKFKYILPLNSPVNYNINPSGTAIVILDTQSQSMTLVDINGNVQDITNTKYVYTKEDKTTVFNKEDVLEKYSEYNYTWCSSPQFIDDENIAYLSQLPHISSDITKKFLWAVNIKNKDRHVYNYSMSGENLRFGKNTDKGLELIMDDGSIKNIRLTDNYIKVTE